MFDRMESSDIVWFPYTREMVIQLPPYCLEGSNIWRAVVPLICFHIIEWHQPDRCMRQFGMVQHIPRPPSQPDHLNDVTLKGKTAENWRDKHPIYVTQWDQRVNYYWTNEECRGKFNLPSNSEYMVWYNKHTRRWISQSNAKTGNMIDTLERMYFTVTSEGESTFSFANMRSEISHCLQICRSVDRITSPAVYAPEPSHPAQESQVTTDNPAGRVEGKRLHRRRRRVPHEQLTIPPAPQPEPGMYYVPPVDPFQPVSSYYYPSQPSPPHMPSPNFNNPPPFSRGECYMPTPPANITPPVYTHPGGSHSTPNRWIDQWQNAPMMSPASGGFTHQGSSSTQHEPPGLGFNLFESFAISKHSGR